MKGDQIRGWGLCFRSGAQIQVSGSGLKHDFMIRVTSQIDSCQARTEQNRNNSPSQQKKWQMLDQEVYGFGTTYLLEKDLNNVSEKKLSI